ncbi:MAG: radical SAM/SPASM domain-containing protein [Burkholderiaceae bacterium]
MADELFLQEVRTVAKAHLRTLTIIGTYRCTAACRQCCFESSPAVRGHLTLEEITRAIDQARELSPNLKVVVFSGGEATLLRDTLFAALRQCRQRSLLTRLVSNGSWGKSATSAHHFAARLAQAGLAELNLSTGPEHREWIPLQSVENAARAALEHGLRTVVSVESGPDGPPAKETYAVLAALAQQQPALFRLIYSSWMTFKTSGTGSTGPTRSVPREVFGPCDQLFKNIVVTPHRAISACCGLTFEHIPEMKMGTLADAPRGNDLVRAYQATLNDFSKIWLAVEGPATVLRRALGTAADALIASSHHICEVCALMHQNEEAVAELRRIYAEYAPSVLQRFGLKTFESFSPEEAIDEAT